MNPYSMDHRPYQGHIDQTRLAKASKLSKIVYRHGFLSIRWLCRRKQRASNNLKLPMHTPLLSQQCEEITAYRCRTLLFTPKHQASRCPWGRDLHPGSCLALGGLGLTESDTGGSGGWGSLPCQGRRGKGGRGGGGGGGGIEHLGVKATGLSFGGGGGTGNFRHWALHLLHLFTLILTFFLTFTLRVHLARMGMIVSYICLPQHMLEPKWLRSLSIG